jgi:hypothetical protein
MTLDVPIPAAIRLSFSAPAVVQAVTFSVNAARGHRARRAAVAVN